MEEQQILLDSRVQQSCDQVHLEDVQPRHSKGTSGFEKRYLCNTVIASDASGKRNQILTFAIISNKSMFAQVSEIYS